MIAHSVGTWNAYEFLVLARRHGLSMPQQAFLSAMAAPDMAEELRPWRKQQHLDEAAFQASGLTSGLALLATSITARVALQCLQQSQLGSRWAGACYHCRLPEGKKADLLCRRSAEGGM